MKKVSFIIPAYNEDRYIQKVLFSITSQLEKRKIDSEVIVVDNGSTDKTVEEAKKFDVLVNSIEKSTVSYARNTGVSLSTGNLLAFIDGDTVLTNSWFDRLELLLSEKNLESSFCTGCSVVIPDYPSWIEWAWFDQHSKNYIGGANIVCSRKCFLEVNGFDENLETGEDYDFSMRIRDKNIDLHIDENLRAIHLGYPKTLFNFIKREIWHGKGDCHNLRYYFKSKVALVGSAYITLVFLFLSSIMFKNYQSALIILSIIVLSNLTITILRFKNSELRKLPYKYLLNFFYFIGRGLSPFATLKDKFH